MIKFLFPYGIFWDEVPEESDDGSPKVDIVHILFVFSLLSVVGTLPFTGRALGETTSRDRCNVPPKNHQCLVWFVNCICPSLIMYLCLHTKFTLGVPDKYLTTGVVIEKILNAKVEEVEEEVEEVEEIEEEPAPPPEDDPNLAFRYCG